ncbi:amino acid adenylation domain-containing protein [Streptomyces sp. NPDC093097]|uniref:non-ribosomal peptide synthetase n=1 Tax=Streptomyces sp. NPDC093097 TaxID=3366027 RepID=UPI003819F6A6
MRVRNQASAASDRILARQTNHRIPLTVDQERIWLFHQFDPKAPVYNVYFALRLCGELNRGALQRAVDAFVRRHEAVRTTFEQESARPVQVVHDGMSVAVTDWDLRSVATERREEEMTRLAGERVRTAFDLTRGPLLRMDLLRLAEREHVLVVTIDHLVWDRHSMGIFQRELAESYTAFAAGREPELPEIEVHYPDYALWQPQWLREEVRRKQLPYWKSQLAGSDFVLELPIDQPRPPVQTFNGARHPFELGAELSEAVRELARREDVTVNVALLAAWQLLLHRLSGQEDIVVGTTSSTRSRPETEPMIGYFLTMLPLRTQIRSDMRIRDLLRATRATMMGAFDHHDIPFGTLLDELDLARDPSRAPIYQTSFILVDFHEEEMTMAGLDAREIVLDNCTAKDDISLGFFDNRSQGIGHFTGLLEYNTDLFSRNTVIRMSRQVELILEQMTADPDTAVGDVSLIGPEEAQRLLVRWNNTETDREADLCLEDLVARQAKATPEAVAVSCGQEHLTYAELVDRAGRLASHLQHEGVGPETVVGVCLDRSVDLVVGLLGVLMSGGAYLPLNPRHPRERLAAMVSDAGARLVLSRSEAADALAACPILRVELDTDAPEIAARPNTPRRPAVGGERLAQIIYTSGSTGQPKGVEVTHRNLLNVVLAVADEVALTQADVLTAVTPVTFDVAGMELYGPLSRGARVHIVPEEVVADGRKLAALLAETHATVMAATPATWHLLVEAGWRNTGLRALVGGEALPPSLAERVVREPGRTWNVYGPTETTIYSTAHRLDSGTEPVSIGRPLANTRVYVLDERMRPVSVGVPGELYIGGDGVARGYRNRPALTAERFVPDPFGVQPGARLYMTGDKVRYREDGTLVFLGRDDGQVKLRGHRIELGEIEARLASHPGVRRSVVLLREDRVGDKRLVAYTECVQGAPPDAELRAHLRMFLPDYMIPAQFVRVDGFPLNSSGKIDRRCLPAPAAERDGALHAPPRDDVECAVARIWEEVLGVRPIGLHDRFFDVGGHSLLALRLMAELEKWFNQRLPVAALFQGATVERIANTVREGCREDGSVHLVRLRGGSDRTPVFFAHLASGEIGCYMPLASLVEPQDRPLYALASPLPVDRALPYADFAERAAAFAAAIREVQPHGPYTLVGWSYGGPNAHAVAHELEKAGEATEVVLIDSTPHLIPAGQELEEAEIVATIAINLRGEYDNRLKPLAELREMTHEEHCDYLLALARGFGHLPGDAGREQIHEILGLWSANLRLLQTHQACATRGTVTLVRAADDERDVTDSWRELNGQRVDVRSAPGNHYTVLREPGIRQVAAVINAVLASAPRRAR